MATIGVIDFVVLSIVLMARIGLHAVLNGAYSGSMNRALDFVNVHITDHSETVCHQYCICIAYS